ncbi:hypothetical protein E2C01_024270 [Portunus trituberculatus]|uniref:Uncharacterized protein n=1 Tax=Portunus trituberculatus TaxID=210409 RepID=A0A5B7EBU2_PORTR|nr:hypothetical protein [Portunus trituberculatus]
MAYSPWNQINPKEASGSERRLSGQICYVNTPAGPLPGLWRRGGRATGWQGGNKAPCETYDKDASECMQRGASEGEQRGHRHRPAPLVMLGLTRLVRGKSSVRVAEGVAAGRVTPRPQEVFGSGNEQKWRRPEETASAWEGDDCSGGDEQGSSEGSLVRSDTKSEIITKRQVFQPLVMASRLVAALQMHTIRPLLSIPCPAALPFTHAAQHEINTAFMPTPRHSTPSSVAQLR